MTYERFKIRSSESKAWTGGKILRAASSGGLARKETGQPHELLVSKFRASRLSQRAFVRKEHISRSTLQRALKKLDSNPAK
jgi:hypothetical protein